MPFIFFAWTVMVLDWSETNVNVTWIRLDSILYPQNLEDNLMPTNLPSLKLLQFKCLLYSWIFARVFFSSLFQLVFSVKYFKAKSNCDEVVYALPTPNYNFLFLFCIFGVSNECLILGSVKAATVKEVLGQNVRVIFVDVCDLRVNVQLKQKCCRL